MKRAREVRDRVAEWEGQGEGGGRDKAEAWQPTVIQLGCCFDSAARPAPPTQPRHATRCPSCRSEHSHYGKVHKQAAVERCKHAYKCANMPS